MSVVFEFSLLSFFFFKQKTAYDLRISDWSSDVCSSDLITQEFAQETLRDLLRAQQQAISIANIQKTVADYYGLQIKDLLSKRRTRSLARPRQVAMALAKELTEHSLPEIGDAFAGRDHTTVLHACRQIRGLLGTDGKLHEDWEKLIRKLSE